MNMNMTTGTNSTGTNSTDSTSTNMTAMTPWLHFGRADHLLFKTWRPSSNGGIAGACIGLFLFCLLDRCLAGCQRALEVRWKTETILYSSEKQDVRGPAPERPPLVPPFVPSRDSLCGTIYAIHTTFSYALMLAVMTFNGAYIISIIVGLGIGEVLFGRVGRAHRLTGYEMENLAGSQSLLGLRDSMPSVRAA